MRMVERRLEGVPLAYVLGEKEFWSMLFEVAPGVLVPRPETELLVEKVADLSSKKEELVVDIGTGSGIVAVSLAKELPEARIVATDVSARALKSAGRNACIHGVSSITFARGSFFSPLEKLGLEKKCDFVVSNPPYVSEKEWDTLPAEIKDHEPKPAIVAGESGLECIVRLVRQAPDFLKPGGYLCLEIGWGQQDGVLSLFGESWEEPACFNDLNGIPRVVVGRKLQPRS